MSDIVLNMGFCPSCGDVLISTHVHDFRTCSCGKSSIDGGTDYIRVVGEVIPMAVRKVDDRFRFSPDLTQTMMQSISLLLGRKL